MDKLKRMSELIEQLNKASMHYYQYAEPILTDFEYDRLYDELVLLEKETGTILSSSPTQNVGYEVITNLKKVRHEKRMLSLDKTKDVEKLKSFIGSREGVLSWKLDGLTIVLRYNGGELVQAVTRGNGDVGEDITHNARVFKNLPLKIPFEDELVLRGEGVISYSEFERINESLDDEEKYKNPRNLCSGTVRQLNSKVASDRKVMFYAFSLVSAKNRPQDALRTEEFDWLDSLGFDVVEHVIVTADTLEKTVREFESRIEQNDFASDGLVLSFNDIAYGKSLGETAKFPKDSIAFKWKDETAETTLRQIEWSTSRTGLINPVAVFDTVELEGTSVNRASVHNVSILEDLQLGIGDRIKVFKANMIIPQIAENLTKSGNVEIPKYCPVCGGETEIRTIKEGKSLYCTNPNCHAQRVRSLAHFASRDAMNIEGLSEETLKKFTEQGFIETYTDLYSLGEHEEEIKEMDGFGDKSFDNLMASLEKSKHRPMANFIYALGINHVGLSNAKLLCSALGYDIEKIMSATEEELAEIDGFGSVIAHSVHSYFANEKNKALIEKTLKIVEFTPEETVSEEEKTMADLTFVITGDVEKFKNRKELQAEIERLGGKVTSSVTSKTNYLINNDIFSSSAKNKKAKELGVEIITEEEFIKRFLEK